MSCAHISLPIYSTIRLVRSKELCTKGGGGCGVAYSALEQAVGPAMLVQAQSESQRGTCRSLASDQCCAQMVSLYVGIKFSVLQGIVQSMQMGTLVFGKRFCGGSCALRVGFGFPSFFLWILHPCCWKLSSPSMDLTSRSQAPSHSLALLSCMALSSLSSCHSLPWI